jgi:haloalkane dehalogenase
MHPSIRQAYTAPYNSWKNRIATLRFVQDIPLHPEDDSYQVVSEIQDKLVDLKTKPFLICWGEKDFVFDLDFLEEWKRRFPEARIHRFRQAGHYVLEDVFNQILPLVTWFVGQTCQEN